MLEPAPADPVSADEVDAHTPSAMASTHESAIGVSIRSGASACMPAVTTAAARRP
jgi:hypothetical protein